MNTKQSSFDEKSKQNLSRRSRHQTRSNPSSKLLNAAWPKPPSVATRQSHIKTVPRSEFQQSWSKWQQHIGEDDTLECSIEDMEIDEECASAKHVIKKKQVVEKEKYVCSTSSGEQKTERKEVKKATNNAARKMLRGSKRNQKLSGEEINPTTEQLKPTEPCEVSSTSDSSPQKVVNKKLSHEQKAKDALFIIIHVNQVEVGLIKGPATLPVKVYADKFMVQMENEVTKKVLSFRVACGNITSLDVSLKEKPFWIKFTASNIHYVNNASTKSRKSTGASKEETVTLHLGYEEKVPKTVKNDIQELFEIRLSELNLWPADNRNEVITNNELSSTICENDKSDVQIKKPADSLSVSIATKSSTNKSIRKTRACRSSGDSASENNEESQNATTNSLQSSCTQPIDGSIPVVGSVRKRIPKPELLNIRKKENDSEEKVQIKVAKRSHRDNNTDFLEERVKTLSYEAAHYQMLFAQQRIIVQSLTENLQNTSLECENQMLGVQTELECKQELCEIKELENKQLNEHFNNEKEITEVLKEQLETLRNELLDKEAQLTRSNEVLRIRDDTIQQLRTDVTINPSTAEINKKNENTVPMLVMEQTRQNMMQMQVSQENLSLELEQTRNELATKNSQLLTLQQQLERHQNSENEETDNIRMRLTVLEELIVTKDQRIQSLTSRVSEFNASHLNVQETNDELNTLRSQIEDSNLEIEDLKSQLTEYQQAFKQPRDETVSTDWIIGRGEVELTDRIVGVGAWGNVKAGKFRGSEVAVKQIHLLILSPHNRRLFEREMAIASRCRHPCLVQFIGATNDDGTPLFLMELLESDLRSLLSNQSLVKLDCLQIAFDVIRAIAYLHMSKPVPIIHRDISSSNILLYRGKLGWRGKLSDYGAANFVRISMTRHPGALLYSAPEASTADQTPKLDIYSFGVLFCEMCTRELPVPENRLEQIRCIQNADYRSLIKGCLRRDISKRLDSLSVVNMIDTWLTNAVNEGETTS